NVVASDQLDANGCGSSQDESLNAPGGRPKSERSFFASLPYRWPARKRTAEVTRYCIAVTLESPHPAAHRRCRWRMLGAGITLVFVAPCFAGPPFFTDDPVPVDFQHNEFYVFGTLDHPDGVSTLQGPAIEYNRGVAHDTQFHVVLPLAWNVPAHGGKAIGLGDIELGIKYRFLNANDGEWQIGVFPMVELATGSARRGLGNGRTWYRLPLWVQKSTGAWTLDGGGGFIVNPAPGMYNAAFGGLLAQYAFSPRWTLGAEVFRQNALAVDQPGYTLLNIGGYLNVTQHFSLLFSAGGSVAGVHHTVAYLGLYWTWAAHR
ncbi:MAG: hypothetical protein ACREPH_03485, partial [Rhodanobacteraceae bacterium]